MSGAMTRLLNPLFVLGMGFLVVMLAVAVAGIASSL